MILAGYSKMGKMNYESAQTNSEAGYIRNSSMNFTGKTYINNDKQKS